MKRCYGYMRVSTVKQGEGVSLEAQKEAISSFASRNQISITQWFEEQETAAKRGRPIFNQMVSALKRGKADGLIIHRIDRSARNYTDWAIISDLADAGVDIHFATESFDFNSYGGRMAADFQAVVSTNYIRNLKLEIRKGQRGQLKQGLYPWGAPIGYRNNGARKPKTPDPKAAPFVRRGYELYASGEYSLRSLQVELKQLGLRNRRGQPLSLCGVETMLNNPFYCGVIRLKKWEQTFQGAHEPIIPVALYEKVQRIKADRCAKKTTTHNHTYRGLFRCGRCSGPMIPERQKGHVYYRCHRADCTMKSVREEPLEAAIIQRLQHFALSDEDVVRANGKIDALVTQYRQTKVDDTLALQLGQVKDRLDRLTDALIDRLIDKETFAERRSKLILEEARLKERQSQNLTISQKAKQMRKMLELVNSVATAYSIGNPAQKRQIVKWASLNRTVIGKNVYLEPSKWVIEVENAISVLLCGHEPATNRTGDIDIANMLERLFQLDQPPPEILCDGLGGRMSD